MRGELLLLALFATVVAQPVLAATPAVEVAVSGLVVSRALRFGGDLEEIRSDTTLFGGRLALESEIRRWDTPDLTLRASGQVAYATGEASGSEWMEGRLVLFADRSLASRVVAGFGLGVQATSLLLPPNSRYTGHRYIAVPIAVELVWAATSELRTVVEGSLLPVVHLDEESPASGEANAFGASGGLRLAWCFGGGAPDPRRPRSGVSAGWHFQRWRTQFPAALRLGSRGGISEDDLHVFSVQLQIAR